MKKNAVPEQREPLVLKLLRTPVILAKAVFITIVCICLGPFMVYLSLTQKFVLHPALFQGFNQLSYLFYSVLRWIFSISAVPLVLLQYYLILRFVWFCSISEGEGIAQIMTFIAGTGLVAVFFSGWKILSRQLPTKLGIPEISLSAYFSSAVEAQTDLFIAVLTIIVSVCLIRLYQLINNWNPQKSTFKKHVLHQLLFTFIDFICFPFLGIVCLTFWRFNTLKVELKKNESSEIECRKIVITQGFKVFLDIPYFILSVPIFLTIWRAFSLHNKLRNISPDESHSIILNEFFMWLTDLPYLCMVVVIVACFWRLPELLTALYHKKTLEERKSSILQIFLLALLDLPVFVAGVVVSITFWYSKEMWKDMKGMVGVKRHLIVLKYFSWLLRDSPFIAMFVLSHVALWRIYFLWKKISVYKTYEDRREICLDQFFSSLLDIPAAICTLLLLLTVWEWSSFKNSLKDTKDIYSLSFHYHVFIHSFLLLPQLPYIAALIFITFTWRTYFVWKDVLQSFDKAERKKHITTQLICVLLDVLALVGGLFVVITFWHFTLFKNEILEKKKQLKEMGFPLYQTYSLHIITLWYFFISVLDLPFLVLAILSLWRFPKVFPLLLNDTTPFEKRSQSLLCFTMCLLDVPVAVAFSIVFVTRWHYKDMMSKMERTDEFLLANHMRIFKKFYETLCDLPYFLCIMLTMLTIYRFPILWSGLNKEDTLQNKRNLCVKQFRSILLDLPAFLGYLLLTVTIWHYRDLKNALKVEGADWHFVVFKYMFLLILDLPFIFFTLITGFSWKLPELYRSLSACQSLEERRKISATLFASMLLDIPALIGMIYIYITQWHVSDMNNALTNAKGLERHFIKFRYFGYAIMDTPYFLGMIILLVTVIRFPSLLSYLKEAKTLAEKRKIILTHICFLLLDIPASFCGLVVFLFVWHAREFLQKLKESQGLKKHELAFNYFIATLLELPFILCSFLVFVTLWRSYTLYQWLAKANTNREKRVASLVQLGLAFLDIPALICSLFVFLSIWKSSKLYRELKEVFQKKNGDQNSIKVTSFSVQTWDVYFHESEAHRIIFINFGQLVADIPFLILLILLLVVPWRLYLLHLRLKSIEDYWEVRKEIARQLVLVIFDFPLIVCFGILNLTWRGPMIRRETKKIWGSYQAIAEAVVKKNEKNEKNENNEKNEKNDPKPPTMLKKSKKAQEKLQQTTKKETSDSTKFFLFHKLVFSQFLQLLVDLPFVILSPLLLWRSLVLINDIRNQRLDLQNFRKRILNQFLETLLDLPYVPFVLFCIIAFWRLMDFWKAVSKIENDKHRRREILLQSWEGLLDGICLVLVSLMMVTLWRAYMVIQIILNINTRTIKREEIFKLFLEWVNDVPYVPVFLASLPAFWRVPYTIWKMTEASSDQERRLLITYNFLLSLHDILCIVLSLLMISTLWMAYSLLWALFHLLYEKKYSQIHKCVYYHFLIWSHDLPYVPLVLIHLLFFWRFPFTVWKVFKASSHNEKHEEIVEGFLNGIMDIICLILGSVIVVTVWRVPSLIYKLKTRPDKHFVFVEDIVFLVVDIFQILQVLFVILTVNQIPSLTKRSYYFLKFHMNTSKTVKKIYNFVHTPRIEKPAYFCSIPNDMKLEIFSLLEHADVGSIASTCKEFNVLSNSDVVWQNLLKVRWDYLHNGPSPKQGGLKGLYQSKLINWRRKQKIMCKMDGTGVERDYKLGLRVVIHEEFVTSVKYVPHTLVIPLKLIGLISGPVFSYVKYRITFPETVGFPGKLSLHLSQGYQGLNWWTLHRWAFHSLGALIGIVINDISLIFAAFNAALMWIQTLGNNQNTILEIIQSILLPFVLLLHLYFFFWVPSYVNIGFYFWLPWSLIWASAIHITLRLHSTYFWNYDPFKQWRVLYNSAVNTTSRFSSKIIKIVNIILQHIRKKKRGFFLKLQYFFQATIMKVSKLLLLISRILGVYDALLVGMTHFCKDKGMIGEILLIPLTFGWILWPLLVPLLAASTVLYVPAGIAVAFLMTRGYKIIKSTY